MNRRSLNSDRKWEEDLLKHNTRSYWFKTLYHGLTSGPHRAVVSDLLLDVRPQNRSWAKTNHLSLQSISMKVYVRGSMVIPPEIETAIFHSGQGQSRDLLHPRYFGNTSKKVGVSWAETGRTYHQTVSSYLVLHYKMYRTNLQTPYNVCANCKNVGHHLKHCVKQCWDSFVHGCHNATLSITLTTLVGSQRIIVLQRIAIKTCISLWQWEMVYLQSIQNET